MTVTWTDAIVFAFAWSCIWGSLLVSHVLDWKFEWCSQNYGFFTLKGNLLIQRKSSLRIQSFQIKFANHSKN